MVDKFIQRTHRLWVFVYGWPILIGSTRYCVMSYLILIFYTKQDKRSLNSAQLTQNTLTLLINARMRLSDSIMRKI